MSQFMGFHLTSFLHWSPISSDNVSSLFKRSGWQGNLSVCVKAAIRPAAFRTAESTRVPARNAEEHLGQPRRRSK